MKFNMSDERPLIDDEFVGEPAQACTSVSSVEEAARSSRGRYLLRICTPGDHTSHDFKDAGNRVQASRERVEAR